MVPHVVEQIVARWQRAGANLSGWAYEEAAPDNADRFRLRTLRDLASKLGIVRVDDGVALSVLTGATGWQDQVFHAVLLPLLRDRLEKTGADLVSIVEPWLESFGLPNVEQVRTLARLHLLSSDTPSGHSLAALLALFDTVQGNGKRLHNFLKDLAQVRCELLSCALPFWGISAMVPAILARFATELGKTVRELSAELDAELKKESVRELSALLTFTAAVVKAAAQPLDALRRGFAALLYSKVDETAKVRPLFLYQLLEQYGVILGALDLERSGDDAGNWYRDAALLLDSFPETASRVALNQAWVKDFLLGLAPTPTSPGPGSFLTTALYRNWCEWRRDLGEGEDKLTEPLTALMRAAPKSVGCNARNLIEPILNEEIGRAKTRLDAAAISLLTVRMTGASLPVGVKARLLSRTIPEHMGAAALSAWEDADGKLESAVGRLAHAMGGGEPQGAAGLLWEILLSPRLRWPGLRARLQRMLNLAEMQGQANCWGEQAGDLLRVICNPEEAAGVKERD